MKVLFVNHTGLVSGAEVATLNLLRGLPGDVEAVLACPEGALAERARRAGIQVEPVPGVTASLRLHPLETSRGAVSLLRLARTIRVLAGRLAADVVHAASIRAGLAGSLPPGPGRALVVCVHDCLPPGRVTAATKRVVDRGSAIVVANSHYTASAWRGTGRPPRVAHPPVDLERHRRRDRTAMRARLGLADEDSVLGVVAQITAWKGQETAIRALAEVCKSHTRAKLLLVGQTLFVDRATRYDNRAYLASLKRTIAELGLEPRVRFLGQRDDVPEVLSALDVLLVPSSEEPFGLVILEAMAAGTPVVATSRGGPAEVVVDGENGRLVPPGRPEPWADAVTGLLSSEPLRDHFAREGLLTAERFSISHYVENFSAIYREAIS